MFRTNSANIDHEKHLTTRVLGSIDFLHGQPYFQSVFWKRYGKRTGSSRYGLLHLAVQLQ